MLYSGWPRISSTGGETDLSNRARVYYFRLSVFVYVRKNYGDREISPGGGGGRKGGEGLKRAEDRQMSNAGAQSSSSSSAKVRNIYSTISDLV